MCFLLPHGFSQRLPSYTLVPVAVSPIFARRGFAASLLLLFAGMPGLNAAESEGRRPATSAGNLDRGLNRLRESRSGAAGEIDSKDSVPAAKAGAPGALPAAPSPSAPSASSNRPAAPAASPVVSPAKPAPAAPTAVAVAPPAASKGIGSSDVMIGVGILILIAGLWMHWTQEGYRMDAEEAIKDNKISADAASRRMANRRLAASVAVLAGLGVFLLGLLG